MKSKNYKHDHKISIEIKDDEVLFLDKNNKLISKVFIDTMENDTCHTTQITDSFFLVFQPQGEKLDKNISTVYYEKLN